MPNKDLIIKEIIENQDRFIRDFLLCFNEEKAITAEIRNGRAFQSDSPLKKPLYLAVPSRRYKPLKTSNDKRYSYASNAALKLASEIAQRIVSNNEYLLAIKRKDVSHQFAVFKRTGIAYSELTYKSIKSGKTLYLSPIFIAACAAYHNEPITRFITQDYAARKLMPYGVKTLTTLEKSGISKANNLRKVYKIADAL